MATPEKPQERPRIVQKGNRSYERLGPNRLLRIDLQTGERTLFVVEKGTLVKKTTWMPLDRALEERARSLETDELLRDLMNKRPHK